MAKDTTPAPRMLPGAPMQDRSHPENMGQAGFTLIELLVAISILVIMATWAVPNYQKFIARNEVAAEVMRIRTALAIARNTAITRRTTVTLCPSDNEITCSTDDWTKPLVVVEGQASGGNLRDTIMLRKFPVSKVISITYRDDGKPIRYQALGHPAGHNGTFKICGRRGEGKRLMLSNYGRIRIDAGNVSICSDTYP